MNQVSVCTKKNKLLLHDITLEIPKGEINGLTGISGSGKTTILKSFLGMLPLGCQFTNGHVVMDGTNMEQLSEAQRREIRGKRIGFIPQHPMNAFDDQKKMGKQMKEIFRIRLNLSTLESDNLIKKVLQEVNLPDIDRLTEAYPGELSGGMLQRVAVAILLGLAPDYILADEPTASLDKENRDALLKLLQEQLGDRGILFVSHDIAALRNITKMLYVIENGEMLEKGLTNPLLDNPHSHIGKLLVREQVEYEGSQWRWQESG